MNTAQRLPDIFLPETIDVLHARIDALREESRPLWGKMTVSQMLAHCSIPLEQALDMRSDGPSWFMKLIMRSFFKKAMLNEKPYRPNLPTAPSFVVADLRLVEAERQRLKLLLGRFSGQGAAFFEGKMQITLGALSSKEWSNLMYKHLDHHLRQFGV
jgi:hypothetical protein